MAPGAYEERKVLAKHRSCKGRRCSARCSSPESQCGVWEVSHQQKLGDEVHKFFSSTLKINIYSGYLPLAASLLSDLVLMMTLILKLSTVGYKHSLGGYNILIQHGWPGSVNGKVIGVWLVLP